jgi:carbon monoxide dehydrogenase subunit G
MEFTGSHKIKASQVTVFNAILNPAVLKESIPGCSGAEYTEAPWAKEDGRLLKLDISANLPGLSGAYSVFVKPEEITEPSHIVLVTNPSNSLGSIQARCVVDLVPEGDQTIINYTTTAKLEGKLAAIPEIVVKPAVKGTLEKFFKNLEKHI